MSYVVAPQWPPLIEQLRHVDDVARATAQEAVQRANAIEARVVPRRTGRLAEATKARAVKAPQGWRIVIQTRKTAHGKVTSQEVARFVGRGTGIYGPRHGPIHAKRQSGRLVPMHTPWGPREEISGQRSQPFMNRLLQSADPIVTRVLSDGIHRIR